jgi:hypothetical protein
MEQEQKETNPFKDITIAQQIKKLHPKGSFIISEEVEEHHHKLICQLKKKFAEKQGATVKELIQNPFAVYPKIIDKTPVKKKTLVTISESKPYSSESLEAILRDLEEASTPFSCLSISTTIPSVKSNSLEIINELEQLTGQTFKDATCFIKGNQPNEDFEKKIQTLNIQSDLLFDTLTTDVACRAKPAFKRLSSFVKKMHETNADLVGNNSNLNKMSLFARYQVSIETLYQTLTEK